MANIEITDDQIVDAILANPDLVVQAFRRLLDCNDSLKKHAERQGDLACRMAMRATRNETWTPLICSKCQQKTIALWEGGLCGDCTRAASAMSAGTAETAEQAQGETRQRGGEAETPNG